MMPSKSYKIQLSDRFNKAVVVNSNEEAAFVMSLDAHDQLRDTEAGVNPQGATHEVVKDAKGNYHVSRFRFSAI
jgi:hypothetical protein